MSWHFTSSEFWQLSNGRVRVKPPTNYFHQIWEISLPSLNNPIYASSWEDGHSFGREDPRGGVSRAKRYSASYSSGGM